ADRVGLDWERAAARLAKDANAARVFLPEGRSPRPGERHRQPALAATLRAIAAKGRDGFYLGPVAEDMVGYLRSLGGLHTLEDFAATKGEYVRPIRAAYRGVEIHQIPPNNQALTALIMLNILAGWRLADHEPFGAERLHLEIEAGRLAFRYPAAFIAEPRQYAVPSLELRAMHYGQRMQRRVPTEGGLSVLPAAPIQRSDLN